MFEVTFMTKLIPKNAFYLLIGIIVKHSAVKNDIIEPLNPITDIELKNWP